MAARLLEAAERRVAAAGLQALRARDLAADASCSVGAIYGAYPDLDELVLQVNRRTLDQIDAALDQAGPGDDPAEHLVRLALAYLDYAAANRKRWDTLFQHRMAPGRTLPGWYAARRHAAFQPVEAPLATLRPELDPAALARTLFAAVHGIVGLGLDGVLAEPDLPALRAQLGEAVTAFAQGLGKS